MAKKLLRPPIKIAVVNDKGGVGKTTLCMMLCMYLASKGKRVLLHDTDISGSAIAWSNNAASFEMPLPFDVCDNNNKDDFLFQNSYHFIVVDTPTDAKAEANIRSLVTTSDYMIIPLRPGSLELDRMKVTMKAIRSAPKPKPGLSIGFVINANQRTKVAQGTTDFLADQDYPVIASIPSRSAYQASFGYLIPPLLLEPAGEALKNLGIRV